MADEGTRYTVVMDEQQRRTIERALRLLLAAYRWREGDDYPSEYSDALFAFDPDVASAWDLAYTIRDLRPGEENDIVTIEEDFLRAAGELDEPSGEGGRRRKRVSRGK